MSCSDRRAVLAILAAAPLAACGFEPAYAPGGPAAGLLGRVTVDPPDDRDAFDLVARLEDRLGRTQMPEFRLSHRITVRTEAQAIAPDAAINRYQVKGTVDFALHDLASQEVLTSGTVAYFTAYSAFGTSVATVAAEADAHRRLMRILADQIVTRLIATSGAWNGQ